MNPTDSSDSTQTSRKRSQEESEMEGSANFRQIMPGPSFPEGNLEGGATKHLVSGWKKRVSTACLSCKKSKRKCSGTAPCDNCRALHRECIFDESLDQRRRVAAKRTAEELEYHRDMLNDLFKVIRTADEAQAQRLLEMIRSDATPEEIRIFIDEILARLQVLELPGKAKQETTEQLKALRSRANMQGSAPSFRRQVMDVNFLCVVPPIEVPASPWTTVTDDDAFVSHLVSLYFTWDYPFFSFLDLTAFVKHMRSRDVGSEFCSPFLVNALLAHACSYSEYSEAYGEPGDIMTKGSTFVKEAEKFLERQGDSLSLSTLQGTMIMYERYSMTGQDDLGYSMLHKAIDIADKLGYIGGEGQDIDLSFESRDYYNSTIKTIWGLFQLDTVAHTGFLKPCRIKNVRLTRFPLLSLENDEDCWSPYPSPEAPRKAFFVTYFDKACELSELAKDVSMTLFVDDNDIDDDKERLSVAVDSLYSRLKKWRAALPKEFDLSNKPTPHILLLQIRYHTILISMFNCPRGHNHNFKSTNMGVATDSAAGLMPESGENRASIATSSARAIAQLIKVHQETYGISRAHNFALYAVNLALFLLLDYDVFDISDPDCITLTSAFAIMTTRSILGREVRSVFSRSIRKIKVDGESRWDQLPEGLKDLLLEDLSEDEDDDEEGDEDDNDDTNQTDGCDGCETCDNCLSEQPNRDEGNGSLPSTPHQQTTDKANRAGHGRMAPTSVRATQQGSQGLCEMLCRYEKMTLGSDEYVTGGKV